MHPLACLTFGWLNFALPASVRWRLAPCTRALRGLGIASLIGDVAAQFHQAGGNREMLQGKRGTRVLSATKQCRNCWGPE